MHQIKPYRLWIGHAGDGRDFRQVFDNGIRAVVQLAAEESPIHPPHEMIFYRFPLLDGTGNDTDLLDLAITAVALLVKGEIPTLVCCGGGMSRSPAIAAAALALAKQTNLDECLKCVTESHPTDISPGLWQAIRSTVEKNQSK